MRGCFDAIGAAHALFSVLIMIGEIAGQSALYRINAGAGSYVDDQGKRWEAGAPWTTTGRTYKVSNKISNTVNDSLYQTVRYGPSDSPYVHFAFPAPEGAYMVRLHFAEIYWKTTEPGFRLFDVRIEDKPRLDNYDIFEAAGGQYTAVIEEIPVTVNDDTLDIELLQEVERPKISAIEILHQPSLALLSASHSFDSVNIGDTSTAISATVSNTGPGTLHIDSIAGYGGDTAHFLLSTPTLPVMLPTDSALEISIRFRPTEERSYNADFAFISNDPSSPEIMSLSGTGYVYVPPTVTIVSPASNDTLVAGSIQIHYQVDGDLGNVDHVHFVLDTLPMVADYDFDGSYLFEDVAPGRHILRAFLVHADHAPADGVGDTVYFNTIQQLMEPVVRINAGAGDYTDASGALWLADDTYLAASGKPFSTTTSIAGAANQTLYQTERYAPKKDPDLAYQFPVGDGTFTALLHFAEIYDPIDQAGERVFDIFVEDSLVSSRYDIVAEVGQYTAVVETVSVTVSDEILDIRLAHITQNPKISAIELYSSNALPAIALSPSMLNFGKTAVGSTSSPESLTIANTSQVTATVSSIDLDGASADAFLHSTPPTPFSIAPGESKTMAVQFAPSGQGNHTARLTVNSDATPASVSAMLAGEGLAAGTTEYFVNAGGTAFTDESSTTWETDDAYVNTGNTFSTTDAIAGNSLDPLYQTERWDYASGEEMRYGFPVDSGTYTVSLHFAEIYDGITGTGQRVFSVLIEDSTVLEQFDIFAEVGANTALVKKFDVTVRDNSLDIVFVHEVENPKISAIEIVPYEPPLSLAVSPSTISLGHIAISDPVTNTVMLQNDNDREIVVSSLGFLLRNGDGRDITVTIDESEYRGSVENAYYPLSVTIPAGESVPMFVSVAPSSENSYELALELSGNFHTVEIPFSATAEENPGHPFLHVVVSGPDSKIDYDGDGVERVVLDGTYSHTHEPGHVLTDFTWTEADAELGTGTILDKDFSVGAHDVTLTIGDDNVPQETLSGDFTFMIAPIDSI
ncbi:MAG: choice-of-anchor D domain-containing protein, partial [Chitinivibrionales bacterium]|nr:choice-of-anchor D domain-containing protein [Chitinivibrionales bacterium]MBD3357388.1 choice-of-anchor D domain-containing protein [Chitinivibrionales bacterium]